MKRVLFIDIHNTICSQMAEAWFNLFADGWGKAQSCGTIPAQNRDPLTAKVMAEAGLNLRNITPKASTLVKVAQADILVVMGKDVDTGFFTTDHIWDFPEATGRDIVDYRIQRDAIRQRVQEFIVQVLRRRLNAISPHSPYPVRLLTEATDLQLRSI